MNVLNIVMNVWKDVLKEKEDEIKLNLLYLINYT